MTVEDLSKLSAIKTEIEIIKKQIDNTDYKVISDKVTGSSSEFPYCQKNFTVRGVDYEAHYGKLNRLQKKLELKLNELMDERDKILDFINTVDDGLVRQILMCKYINGLTWEQSGREIGYSSRQMKRKYSKFIKTM